MLAISWWEQGFSLQQLSSNMASELNTSFVVSNIVEVFVNKIVMWILWIFYWTVELVSIASNAFILVKFLDLIYMFVLISFAGLWMNRDKVITRKPVGFMQSCCHPMQMTCTLPDDMWFFVLLVIYEKVFILAQ